MNVTPDEAEEALTAIQQTMQKTRRSIVSSGAYIFLILTGLIWLVGFLSTQFLPGDITQAIWIVMSVLGTALAVFLGNRMSQRVRGIPVSDTARRAGLFWLLLAGYCLATIAVARPTDGKQVTMFILLFIMIGQLGMGLLLSFSAIWWTLPVTL